MEFFSYKIFDIFDEGGTNVKLNKKTQNIKYKNFQMI